MDTTTLTITITDAAPTPAPDAAPTPAPTPAPPRPLAVCEYNETTVPGGLLYIDFTHVDPQNRT